MRGDASWWSSPLASHLPLSRLLWKQGLKPGGRAVDATCGNGKDSLFLSTLIFPSDGDDETEAELICIDVQREAIGSTRSLLAEELRPPHLERIRLFHQSHERFPDCIADNSVDVIVYNLGYLPGGDKSVTTRHDTTITSLTAALKLIVKGGLISVMLYRGHPEGTVESDGVISWASQLPADEWRVFLHEPLNRPTSPALMTLYRL
ncbi:unnamed protein product [Vitrella brassicaformis CCMP3155]|uniref:Methyltransferase domain-containing protein n=1 Tax=Vitrella brassicaformis (strain CCMP3155) TaxID=1169540 RepID=A0A0G4GWR6_VITBC|nr:unnamed protein product [Vitrella brassicaformis CCMP3155]|eukprot:CEM35425.1 unnamed protein product [Vitrella brassicaformis CCMP3155]